MVRHVLIVTDTDVGTAFKPSDFLVEQCRRVPLENAWKVWGACVWSWMSNAQCGGVDKNTPNSQFSASSVFSDTDFTLSLKNGRRMRYALDRRTFGNTFNVPCVGAVSLWNR